MNRTRLGSIGIFGGLLAVGGLSLLTETGMSASEVLDQWYWRNPYPTGNNLYGVAYGNAIFVAVGQGGTIMTSTNSHVWEHQESGTDKLLNQVIFAQDMFVAIGESGVILSSPDGTNWVSHPTIPSYSLRGITFAQGKYVIVGGQIILCSDRLTQWSSRQFFSTPALNDVAYGNGVFMAVGGRGTLPSKGAILISSNGLDWNPVGREDFFSLNSVAFGNGKFVTCGDFGEIWSTADGTNWLYQNIGAPTSLASVSWVDDQFLMVGGHPTTLLGSPDGISWAERESAATYSLSAVAGGDDHYVAVGQYGQIVSSTNSQSWISETTEVFGHRGSWFASVAFGKGRFVAVGSDWIGTSMDGATWANAPTTSPAWLTDVIFGGGRFLAVGKAGNILWSEDGISWQSTTIAPEIQLNSAAYGDGSYLVNGVSGTTGDYHAWLLRSTNLTEWETVFHSTNVFPEKIVYGNGRFVVGAPSQFRVLISADGREWTEVSTGSVGISDMVFANDKFVAIEGQSTSGLDWAFNSSLDRFFASENNLADIAFGDGVFVALNSRALGFNVGSVYTSTNGVRWIRRISSPFAFYDVAYGNGTFVAVGQQAAILQSTNLANLVPIHLSGSMITNRMFNLTINSAAGLTLTVETSSDLQSWQTLRTLVNESGETNLIETMPLGSSHRFYRARTSN